MSDEQSEDVAEHSTTEPRRSFFASLAAALLGVAALAAPVGAGLVVLMSPLRRKPGGGQGHWIRVAALDQVPTDGKPHPFPVIEAEPRDKWNLYGPQPVGAVFLTRSGGGDQVTALSSICPHLGCVLGYDARADRIVCPCHNAIFECEGKQDAGSTVSPRDLDPLEVKVESNGDILVEYKRFKGGIAQREEV